MRFESVPDLASPGALPEPRVAAASTAPHFEPQANSPTCDAPDRAVRELQSMLESPGFHGRSFEAAGRSLAESLSPEALAELGNMSSESPAGFVSAAALVRLSALPPDERSALGRRLLPGLRTCLQDIETPLPVAREAAAALAVLGDEADRSRLFDDVCSAGSGRAREIARAGLARAGGIMRLTPDAISGVVDRARRADDPEALGAVLCVATAWLHEDGELPSREAAHCAALFEAIATDERNSTPRARALSALAVVDESRAAHVAIDWFGDADRSDSDAGVAASVLRECRLDPMDSATLFETLDDERRAILAETLLARTPAEQDDGTIQVARQFARVAVSSGSTTARRRAVSTLASSPDVRDRELCAQLARSDPDESVREHAERALRRALRDEPAVSLGEPR